MTRKPRTPRSPRSLSLKKESLVSPAVEDEVVGTNRDSVPTADLSGEDITFPVLDDADEASEELYESDNDIVRDIFSAPSVVAEEEDEEVKDSLLARVSKRVKKKQVDTDDEISAMRQNRRASRRKSWRLRIVWAFLAVCVIAGGVYAVFFSSLFRMSLDDVDISAPAGSPINESDIRASLVEYEGLSLFRLSTDSLAQHIEEKVAGTDNVDVSRSLPHGLSISYSLKKPYACLVNGASCNPIDDTGRVIPEAESTDIASLLHISYAGNSEDISHIAHLTHSVVDALGAVDESISSSISRCDIDGHENITLVFDDNRVVVWGQSSDNQKKAEVLSVLLSQPAAHYDISIPDAPVTR